MPVIVLTTNTWWHFLREFHFQYDYFYSSCMCVCMYVYISVLKNFVCCRHRLIIVLLWRLLEHRCHLIFFFHPQRPLRQSSVWWSFEFCLFFFFVCTSTYKHIFFHSCFPFWFDRDAHCFIVLLALMFINSVCTCMCVWRACVCLNIVAARLLLMLIMTMMMAMAMVMMMLLLMLMLSILSQLSYASLLLFA